MVSSYAFDNTGSKYNVSRIINLDRSINLQAYKDYSPLFIPVASVISIGLSLASITATLTHFLLFHRRLFWIRQSPSDIHARLMSVYKEVPDWWYLIIFCLFRLFLMKRHADILFSHHVYIRYRCYRGVGHAAPCMGIRAFPFDLCAF